jgi:predicted AlkP superfamily phosphohydrolase/phosphomutase
VELSVVSDHGSGGASDRVLYLNRALEQAGFLRFRRRGPAQWALGQAKEAALTRLSPRWRERLFRAGGALLPGLVESRARFASLDLAHTRVFSDELNYFPALHFNLRGREPRGCVEPEQLPQLRAELEAALGALRDPFSGSPVIQRVWGREELFHGPFLERAPDLLLELERPDGYSYNLMPSGGAPADQPGPFRRLQASEYLGRKGRSLPGSHRERGLFIACGPRVRASGVIDAAIADVSATLLARMDTNLGLELDGRVLQAALHGSALPRAGGPQASAAHGGEAHDVASHSSAAAPTEPAQVSRSGSARVEERLRRLGYIE